MEERYQAQEVEEQAQQYWQEHNCFQVTEDIHKEKFYCLTMFPYPSGHLHMGHVRVYTIGDVIARYQYMLGKNILQPMGWDAFGLPAENAAIKNRIAPAQWTLENIQHMRTQMQRMGFGYDWSRELTTCHPDYYRWEQYFFLKLYEKGLAYKKNAEVNWDPVDQTVLANEQVENGRGWRSGALVERREIPQWFLKITAYAEELLNDLDHLPQWPAQVKTMQRHWIGRSEGVDITFSMKPHDPLTIFTTRPDTLFGMTYIAIAPQHPLAKKAAQQSPALQAFLDECRHTKLAEAEMATAEKKGMPLGIDADHPLTGEKIPLWVANFVLMEYGAGAIMAVPAHDQRDFEFAIKYHLPIKPVIAPEHHAWDFTQAPLTTEGVLIDSGSFTGLDSQTAKTRITAQLVSQGIGQIKVNYRLRDWGVSRQRYWGAPIPIIYCSRCGTVPVPEKDLPVILPEKVHFTGVASPLRSIPEFFYTPCPTCGGPAERETDTFDTFVESSWYYARFACKKQPSTMLDGRVNYWVPVDQYVGGIEHAVLHLLYARFFHKLMRDEGLVNSNEPFTRLLSQGMVLNQGAKMSKSKGNIIDPQQLVQRYGADTVRLFMIFAAPPEQNLEWSDSGVEGAERFLKRLWSFAYKHHAIIQKINRTGRGNLITTINWDAVDPQQCHHLRQLYEITDQARYDFERQQFNTVVSACMKIFNLLSKMVSPPPASPQESIYQLIIHHGYSILLRLLAPITPHIAHQLWQELQYGELILKAPWPTACPITFHIETIEVVVQIDGKLRGRLHLPIDADQQTIENSIKQHAQIQQAMTGKTVKKIITVPGRLINIVTETL